MKVIQTDLPGCLVLEPQVFGDERGFFYESFNRDKLAAVGLAPVFVQGNVSASARGVLRGLHYQWRSEEHTSELQSLMRISYAVFCLKKKNIYASIYKYY